jgi:hypothetical protein
LLRDLLVDRNNVIAAVAVMKNAHNRGVSTVHWADNSALGAAIAANCADLDQHAVAVHG